jgi:Fe-S cluster biogenesis protein NfuA
VLNTALLNALPKLNKTEKIVLKAIDDLRPYLRNDGGDMELVEITSDNRVIVKLLGACQTCSVSSVTMKAGLEENLKLLIPEIVSVEALQE